jgi:hypothetical protein
VACLKGVLVRRLSALVLVVVMAVAGCGSSKTASTAVPSAAGASASAAAGAVAGASPLASTGSSMAPTAAAAAASCPSSNSRSFAKTRFVADLGGAAFLIRRYIYQPYTRGSFIKGHPGRTLALVKAAATAGTVVHLLKNASLNAKANPTLCKTIAAPLAGLTSTVSGLAGSLRGGAASPGVIGGLGGAVSGLLGKAKAAGVPVTEKAPTGA